ncbi:SDR family oxidoreductase [Acidothermaceae bacterium B102]|nr:SDR family oxidoreductase [Acidothermaceae bacterium B102]
MYATARTPLAYADPRVVPLALDVTDAASVAAVAEAAPDVTILVNNAGVTGAGSLVESRIEDINAVLDTNLLGPIRLVQAFAPILSKNGGGAIVNVASALSWLAGAGDYGVSKAALWQVSNTLRVELRDQGTLVQGLHLGYTDTDMTADVTAPKGDPRDVVAASLDGLEAGAAEVLADQTSVYAKSLLGGDPAGLALR